MNRLFVEGRTHIGPVRKENQDNFRIAERNGDAAIAVVCDGMGGATFGREASEIAVNAIFERISAGFRPDSENNSVRNLMISAVCAANAMVYTESRSGEEKNGMGTTCVAAIVKRDTAFVASVGDSRAYLINSKGITQLTNDHTYVEMLYKQGKITKEEMKQHKMRNVITKAVGTEENVDVDYFEIDLEPSSVILLCSDGLTNYCSNELIFNFVYQKDIKTAADELVDYVNTHGGKDNITVVLVKN